jgi:nucleoid-associated protein YgaU
MRAELKIGIAVGLIIAVVAVGYVVFRDSGAKHLEGTPQARPAPPVVTPAITPAAPPESGTLVPTFAAGPAPAPAPAAPAELPVPLEPTIEVAELPAGNQPTTRPAAPEATRAETPLAVAITPPTTQPVVAAMAPAVTPRPPAPMASTATSYVVQPGDKGFWGIAEKVYGPGKGKHWTLIAKANPQVESTRLKEGMRLTIPPLPGEPTVAAPRVTPLTTAGEKVYVVQPDDGWWAISRKAYGDGKYWRELSQANPQVQGMLKAGQKVRIPPLEEIHPLSPSAAPAPAAPVAPATPAAPAERPPGDDRPIFD